MTSHENNINSCFINISVDKFAFNKTKGCYCWIPVENFCFNVNIPKSREKQHLFHISTALVMIFF